MAFFRFRKPGPGLLSKSEQEEIVQAIRDAESRTSGEIRVFIERKCKHIDPLERAAEVFFNLKMDQTANRNGVLLYMAVRDRQLAIFGDEGIYQKTGKAYWENLVRHILQHFNNKNFAAGLTSYVRQIGEGLHQYFPYDKDTDQNELPDDIVFG